MTPPVVPASFRDPAGFVWTDGTAIFRHVGAEHQKHYDHLMSSGLYDALVADGLLVPHREIADVASPRPDAYKVLQPEVVAFVSYPYEWCVGALRAAALATLAVAGRALDFGMSLRDASAYNIQFHRGRPVLIDTLSFEVLSEERPWIAYGQFLRHFLAPLALGAYVDPRLLALSRLHIDGVPLDLAAGLLPRRTKLRGGLLAHIHAQARPRPARRGAPGRTFTLQRFRGLLHNLERTVHKLEWEPSASGWSEYYEEATHYSDDARANKAELVGKFLDDAAGPGAMVWDLGANTGVFAREATKRGMSAVCFDADHACVEANYRRIVRDGEKDVLPLVCDLTNPSPSTGWASTERASLIERGPADVVLALALVHHLAIGNNVPLEMVARFLAAVGRSLVIEFVPKQDQMAQKLLETREDIFPNYTAASFESAFAEPFTIDRREAVADTGRTLYLMRRR
jgi:hypothetical protein